MIVADLHQIEGRTYPARWRTRNLVGMPRPFKRRSLVWAM